VDECGKACISISSPHNLCHTHTPSSADPSRAGRASDIIIGGGFEMQVTEMVKVYKKEMDDERLCLNSTLINTWEPAKMTTFVYPVHRIIDEMNRIKAKAGHIARQVAQLEAGEELEGITDSEATLRNQSAYLEEKYDDWQVCNERIAWHVARVTCVRVWEYCSAWECWERDLGEYWVYGLESQRAREPESCML
jgi:hypothetical protein